MNLVRKSQSVIGQPLSAISVGIFVVLTTATQLRPASLPLGPGESLLTTWIFVALLGLAMRRRTRINRVLVVFASFWLLALGTMLAGWLVTSWNGRWDVRQIRDLVAFSLVAVFSLAYLLQPDLVQRVKVSLYVVVRGSAVVGVLLLMLSHIAEKIGPLSLWYGSSRFTGWASNPNQMALLLLLPPVFLLQKPANHHRRAIVSNVLLFVGCVWAGLATRSDALKLTWLASFACYVASRWAFGILSRKRHIRAWHALAFLAFAVLSVSILVVFGQTLLTTVDELYYAENAQGRIRLSLWYHGVLAFASSPIVGLGPGPHSGITGPFEGEEAHNSFIDWAASTGAVGVLGLISLLLSIGYRAWHNRDAVALSALAAIVVYSMFHYTLRHPLIWFYVMALTVVSEVGPQPTHRQLFPRLG